MRVRTLHETVHGNPGDPRRLPAGALCVVVPADNLTRGTSDIEYWASPLTGNASDGWPEETRQWAEVGVGLNRRDFEPI